MSLLIKNVQILGAPREFAGGVDVFVSGDTISAIGNFPDKRADQVFDGQGAYLAPGFIDVNTDSDHYLSIFDNPAQIDFLRQGVTTIIGGQCGSSLAPLLYGSLESIQKWTDVSKVNVGWHTLEELLKILEKKPLGVNFGTFVGHSTIRRALIGESLRDLTKNELIVFTETLKRTFLEGAMGFSTGLGYVHSRETPYNEIKSLAQATKNFQGVYSTHLRKSGKELNESVDETIRISQETGVSVMINHFMPLLGAETEYEDALDSIQALSRESDFHFNLYPFETSVLPLYTFLPTWAQNGGMEVMVSNVMDSWLKERIIKDLPKINPADFVVAYTIGNDALIGQSLADLMNFYYIKDSREALIKLMQTTRLRASILYKNINAGLIRKGILHPRSMISSNAASLPLTRHAEQPERASATFSKFIKLAEVENIMPLKAAIQKITLEPARKFKLQKRGEIREGFFADLVCFKNGEIKCTVVNGHLAFKNNESQEVLAGRPLKHHGY